MKEKRKWYRETREEAVVLRAQMRTAAGSGEEDMGDTEKEKLRDPDTEY